MTRINSYIDGFNLYHSIVDIAKKHTPQSNYLKWLNLRDLSNFFVNQNEQLNDVYYFTAYAKHVFDAYKRHEKYIKALELKNVQTVLGQFKKKYPKCKQCKQKYITHEEKESDINIAIQILQDAYQNKFDKAFLITADSDLVSIVKKINVDFPSKEIIVLVPPGRVKYSSELRKNANMWYEIKESYLKKCLLPKQMILQDGTVLEAPVEYNIP